MLSAQVPAVSGSAFPPPLPALLFSLRPVCSSTFFFFFSSISFFSLPFFFAARLGVAVGEAGAPVPPCAPCPSERGKPHDVSPVRALKKYT